MGNTQIAPNEYSRNKTQINTRYTVQRGPWFMCTYKAKKSSFLTHFNEVYQVYTNYPERVQDLERIEHEMVIDVDSPSAEPSNTRSDVRQDIRGTNIVSSSLRTAQVKQVVAGVKVEKGTSVGQLVNDLVKQGTLLKQFGNQVTQNVAWASVNNATNHRIVLKDEDKVSLLFHWLTSQNVVNRKFSLCIDPYLVDYNLIQLNKKENTYAAVFALLCACADIPCVIVRGLVKGGHHDPGVKISDKYIREWNAVLVDGTWRLVDTFWGSVYDPATNQQTTDDWYLFPNPTEFSYSHHPDTQRWQLLDQPKSKDEFEGQVYLRKRFFELQMTVLSHSYEQVICKDGEAEFTFRLCSTKYESQDFRCIVSMFNESVNMWEVVNLDNIDLQPDFIQKLSCTDPPIVDELPRLVTRTPERTFVQALPPGPEQLVDMDDISIPDQMLRERTTLSNAFSNRGGKFHAVSLKVRFPLKGVYKVDIVGRGQNDTDYDWIAIYRVAATGVPMWKPFFPKMEDIGWGPNAYLKQCQLKAASHYKGDIYCKAGETVKVKFRIPNRNMTLTYELKVSQLKLDTDNLGYNLADARSATTKDFSFWEWSKVIDTEGQYKLTFKAKDNRADYGNVIHYLIVCDKCEEFLGFIRECRELLEKAIDIGTIEQLDKAVGLTETRGVKNKADIQPLYNKADKKLRKLKRIEELEKSIPDITNRLVSNLQAIHNPESHVVTVMKATFIILGENRKKLQFWKEDILPLITNLGDKNLCRRIQTFDIKTLERDKTRIANALEILGPAMNLGEIANVNQDVAAFARWLQLVLESQ